MASLIRRRPGTVTRRREDWDPFSMMREMMNWSPLREMRAPIFAEEWGEFVPDFEFKENDDGFVLRADVPGVAEKDIDVSITGNTLTVTGKREEEKRKDDDQYYAYERRYGKFTRTFALPEAADGEHAQADLSNGVLTIAMPRRAELKARKIKVAGKSTSRS